MHPSDIRPQARSRTLLGIVRLVAAFAVVIIASAVATIGVVSLLVGSRRDG